MRQTYNYRSQYKDRKPVIITVLVLVAAIALITGVIIFKQPKSVLPAYIHEQVSFAAYVPDETWHVESSSYHYTSSSGVLSYSATQSNTKLTFTEQAAPSQFTDIPQFYPTLLDKLNQYQSIGTVNGTVNLVHPTELKGKQQAVLSNNGTLIFVNPSKDLTADEWRKLFNNMQVIR